MSARAAITLTVVLLSTSVMSPATLRAAEADSALSQSRPATVAGGFDDKPHLTGMFGRVHLGGYLEFDGAWERVAGATDELGFGLTRLSLMASTRVRDRVNVWTEIEFEEGGEEIEVELAQVDLMLHRAANVRGGILLLPLGRFNLAHDGPRTELPRRPLLATELMGSALSQPGMGLFGETGSARTSRFTYEAYAVNGYHAGLLEGSPDGTRLPTGASNQEDTNASPAWIARVAWDRARRASIGLSGYTGAYNRFRIEGIDVDSRRDVAIGVVDAEWVLRGFRLSGEAAQVYVQLPPSLAGLFASRQAGATLQLSRSIGVRRVRQLPDSWFTLAVRAEVVDFDRDRLGDSSRALTVGLNFRPVPESVFKFACTRRWDQDRFANQEANVAWVLGLASYF